MTCQHVYDDGAYVLGALSPAERAAFEGHMSTCPACREAVASLAVLPGLLSRLDAERAFPRTSAPLSVLPRTLAAISVRRRAERRRNRFFAVAAAFAATVLAAGVGMGAQVLGHRNDTIVATFVTAGMGDMLPLIEHLPVTARISATATAGGTRIAMTCRYDEGYIGRWTLRLVLFARLGGASEQLGTWTAESGQEIQLKALTHLLPTEIERVELQRMDGVRLMVWSA
jgi:predicted anti-sigma-YlaC factor YlaD